MLLPAVLGVLVYDLLDEALVLRMCHMDVDGLCGVHAQITSCVQSATLRQSITSTTIATKRTAMRTWTGMMQGLALPL